MTDRDRKIVKILLVLGPLLLLAIWYSYSEVQAVKARKSKAREAARLQQQQQTAESPAPQQAPSQSARRAPTAVKAAPQQAAAAAGIRVAADTEALNHRMNAAWGRDPFIPPDARGPQIDVPEKVESPRGAKFVELKMQITDAPAGNSGVKEAVLWFGTAEPFEDLSVKGARPTSENGDGAWTFSVPAPADQPFGCYVVAVDNGKLNSHSRSKPFQVLPAPKETLLAQIGGAEVKLTLRGISRSGDKGVALINGEVCTEGDVIYGCKVVQVAKDGVLLRRNDKEFLLQLKE